MRPRQLSDRQYRVLRPEERMRALVAAEARGDDVERDRLVATTERSVWSMRDPEVVEEYANLATVVLAVAHDIDALLRVLDVCDVVFGRPVITDDDVVVPAVSHVLGRVLVTLAADGIGLFSEPAEHVIAAFWEGVDDVRQVLVNATAREVAVRLQGFRKWADARGHDADDLFGAFTPQVHGALARRVAVLADAMPPLERVEAYRRELPD